MQGKPSIGSLQTTFLYLFLGGSFPARIFKPFAELQGQRVPAEGNVYSKLARNWDWESQARRQTLEVGDLERGRSRRNAEGPVLRQVLLSWVSASMSKPRDVAGHSRRLDPKGK